jgi:16S rRNA (adenine1518-N6/adenine1519-N6)-dimethyltransferase
MTAGLLERGAMVNAFEIDPGFIKALNGFFGDNPHFSLIPGDVLKTWPGAYIAACNTGIATNADAAANAGIGTSPYLLGNLPYNIAAALLADFIEKKCFFPRIVVTVQREVARRMTARPGSDDYSSFSILCSSVYTVTPLIILKGASFYPAPKVDSQGVRLDLRRDINSTTYPTPFYPLVRGLFASRRKTVRNNLQSFILSGILYKKGCQGDIQKRLVQELTQELLEKCGIHPNERAENLGIDEFSALAKEIAKVEANARLYPRFISPGGDDGSR